MASVQITCVGCLANTRSQLSHTVCHRLQPPHYMGALSTGVSSFPLSIHPTILPPPPTQRCCTAPRDMLTGWLSSSGYRDLWQPTLKPTGRGQRLNPLPSELALCFRLDREIQDFLPLFAVIACLGQTGFQIFFVRASFYYRSCQS